MSSEISKFDQQMIEMTTKVVKRWGVEFPEAPVNLKRAVVAALKQAIIVARSTPFFPVYPNDHSWSSTGLRPLTLDRLKHDERETLLEKSGEEWGVFALAEGFGNAFVIPIAADLSEETARAVSEIIEKDISYYIDAENLPSVLSRFPDETDIDEGEIELTICSGLWENVRELSIKGNLSLSEAVFFRRPTSWDILRAKLSGALCPQFPEFSESDFLMRKNRSVKFNRLWSESTKKILDIASTMQVDLNTPDGKNWFTMVVNGLNSLGLGKPIDGISVIMSFFVHDEVEGPSGIRNLCIGFGLDPVQASYLFDLVTEDPWAFHDLDELEGKRFDFIEASVIPDMFLSAFNATSAGRSSETYDRLIEATKKEKQFINVVN